VLPDEIIDLDNVETVQTKERKKHDMLYSGGTYPERRRSVKKSTTFQAPTMKLSTSQMQLRCRRIY